MQRKFRGQVGSWEKLNQGPSLCGRKLPSEGQLPCYSRPRCQPPRSPQGNPQFPCPICALRGSSLFGIQFTWLPCNSVFWQFKTSYSFVDYPACCNRSDILHLQPTQKRKCGPTLFRGSPSNEPQVFMHFFQGQTLFANHLSIVYRFIGIHFFIGCSCKWILSLVLYAPKHTEFHGSTVKQNRRYAWGIKSFSVQDQKKQICSVFFLPQSFMSVSLCSDYNAPLKENEMPFLNKMMSKLQGERIK